MRHVPRLHVLLGLAGLYARLDAQWDRLDMHARRLRHQEKRMETFESKIARIEGLTTTLGTEIKAAVVKLSQSPVSSDDSLLLGRLDKIGDMLSGDVSDLSTADAVNAGIATGGQTPNANIPADPGTLPDGTPAAQTADINDKAAAETPLADGASEA